MTSLDRKIKLKNMPRTWNFTRSSSMWFKLIETFFYILISNTQNMIYIGMVWSMYMNAGLISLPYPIAVFGYALLEETRPRQEFWNYVRMYTVCLLFLKFFMNLSFFDSFLNSDSFVNVSALLKLGIYNFDDIFMMFFYMSPEILIITFIMLNEIHLKLIGLYY